MLYKTLLHFTQLLNDHLKLSFKLTEDIAFLCPVKESGSVLPTNRMGISLVNIERETGNGIRFRHQSSENNYSHKTSPAWHLNIYVLISAIFAEKQYTESLQLLSGTLSFLQKKNLLDMQESGLTFAIEPVNLSFHEQSNLWGILGGTYYPSILCKIRILTVDEQEIIDLSAIIGEPETISKLKS